MGRKEDWKFEVSFSYTASSRASLGYTRFCFKANNKENIKIKGLMDIAQK